LKYLPNKDQEELKAIHSQIITGRHQNLASEECWRRLKEGNQRFVNYGTCSFNNTPEKRKELNEGQNPFAMIITCADSRVTPELTFQEGLGNLFVVRVAANVIEKSQLGSIEFAVGALGINVIYVVGHTRCGAVCATIKCVREGITPLGFFKYVAEKVKKPVMETLSMNLQSEELIQNKTVLLNAKQSCDTMVTNSILIQELLKLKKLEIRIAILDMATGKITDEDYDIIVLFLQHVFKVNVYFWKLPS